MTPEFQKSDALHVVDMQNDFLPGGALAVPDGLAVMEPINRLIAAARDGGATLIFTRDWHPPDHCSFQMEGGPWPVHCVRGTAGAEFHPSLDLPPVSIMVNKAQEKDREAYSDFEGTGLAEFLETRNIERVWVCGLALDYCVKASAIDAAEAGFETHLLLEATRAVNLDDADGRRAIESCKKAGVTIHE